MKLTPLILILTTTFIFASTKQEKQKMNLVNKILMPSSKASYPINASLGSISFNVNANGAFSDQNLRVTLDSVTMYTDSDCNFLSEGTLAIGGPWTTSFVMPSTTGTIGSISISDSGLTAVANAIPGSNASLLRCAILNFSFNAMNGETNDGSIATDHQDITCSNLNYDSGTSKYTSCTLDNTTINLNAIT